MKKLRIFLLMVLAGIFVLIAIGLFEVITVITAKPKVTVDYVAEYNRISRPANYDPCQNAAALYNAAFNSFVQMPKQLYQVDAKWSDDFNQAQQNLLQNWLIANTDCLQKFGEASQMPYYWVERRAFDGDLRNIQIPESGDIYYICEAMVWNAKINAANGNYSQAIDDILACYRASFQRCTTSRFITEFRDSLWQQQVAMETVSLILAKTQVPASVLNSFQQELQEVSDTYKCSSDLTADKLFLYDILQRTYVYKPDGSGRLSWKGIKDLSGFCSSCGISSRQVTKFWFAGPTQKEVKSQIDSYYEQMMAAFMIVPWKLHQAQPDYFEKLEHRLHLQSDALFLFVYGSDYRKDYYNYYDTQAQLQALLTTIAVLRFRQEKGHLPGELEELVKVGYLRQLPADPYSDKSLVYSVGRTDFKIYSVGDNFKDDGGKGNFYPTPPPSGRISPADSVFWPPWERPKNIDSKLPIQEANQLERKPSE